MFVLRGVASFAQISGVDKNFRGSRFAVRGSRLEVGAGAGEVRFMNSYQL